MNNSIEFYGSKDGEKLFVKSSIKASAEVIEHYNFVISDISSNISDSRLEASKGPTLEFLKDMRGMWVDFKANLEARLKDLEK